MPNPLRDSDSNGGTTLTSVRGLISVSARVVSGFGFSAFGLRLSALSLLLLAGCVSQEEARKQAQQAYEAGFKQGQAAAEAKLTQVFFQGPFQRTNISWRPGLTLAQAIVEAVYTAPNDPQSIVVTRSGTPQLIDPDNLLRGIDFPLEPGDMVQLIP
jgi:hypothetical protein